MIINNNKEEHKKEVKKLEATLKENKEVSNKACQELEKNGKHVAEKLLKN